MPCCRSRCCALLVRMPPFAESSDMHLSCLSIAAAASNRTHQQASTHTTFRLPSSFVPRPTLILTFGKLHSSPPNTVPLCASACAQHHEICMNLCTRCRT